MNKHQIGLLMDKRRLFIAKKMEAEKQLEHHLRVVQAARELIAGYEKNITDLSGVIERANRRIAETEQRGTS